MKTVYSVIFIVFVFLLVPFISPAQTTESISLSAGSSISITNLNTGGKWSSADNDIAYVDPSGSVTGVIPGTVQISYTYVDASFGLQIDIFSVTVNTVSGTNTASNATLCDVSPLGVSLFLVSIGNNHIK